MTAQYLEWGGEGRRGVLALSVPTKMATPHSPGLDVLPERDAFLLHRAFHRLEDRPGRPGSDLERSAADGDLVYVLCKYF